MEIYNKYLIYILNIFYSKKLYFFKVLLNLILDLLGDCFLGDCFLGDCFLGDCFLGDCF